MGEATAVAWLREQVQARLAGARAMLSKDWGDLPWAVTECTNGPRGDCPCIVYQGAHKPFREPQVPPVRYIADAETPEVAQWIAANDPRQVIAGCEADLAILDLYEAQCAKAGENAMEEDRAWALAPIVRLLAGGYKHRPGYTEHWPAMSA